MTLLLSLLLCLWTLAACICLVAFTLEGVASPARVIGCSIVVPPAIVISLVVLSVLCALSWLMAKLTGELE